MKTIAAIDVGSNAVRIAFAQIDKSSRMTIYKKYRIPLRLGSEAFSKGELSEYTIKYAVKAFVGLANLIKNEKAEKVLAVATSACRDIKNSKELIKKIKAESGIDLDLISGDKEAQLIRKAIEWRVDLSEKDALLMDIGGGSMELTAIANKQVIASKSFQLGTVRILEQMKNGPDDFGALDQFIVKNSKDIHEFLGKYLIQLNDPRMIGTGGNFRRMLKLKRKIHDQKTSDFVTPKELLELNESLSHLPYLKRMKKFDLRPDRADVIIPAIRLTLEVVSQSTIKKIYCPDVGLVHGVLFLMAEGEFKEVKDISSST